jgi:methionyl aminopeptidase
VIKGYSKVNLQSGEPLSLRSTNKASHELECYRKAGKIASAVRKEVSRLVQPKKPIIEICEETENMIRRMGGAPAFPTNVSVDHVTAHYTSPPDDETLVPADGLVKVDLGASIVGYLSDTAITVDLSGKEIAMVDTAEKALKAAISIIKAGTNVDQVGRTISNTIASAGFKPISNLTGHSLARFELHSGKSVPNVPTHAGQVVREGEILAIEPFVTRANGKGYVKDTGSTYIFSCTESTPQTNSNDAADAELLTVLRKRFSRLPFALRWLSSDFDLKRFRRLIRSGSVISYPVLVEAGKSVVAQAEHTVLVKKYGCDVLTI